MKQETKSQLNMTTVEGEEEYKTLSENCKETTDSLDLLSELRKDSSDTIQILKQYYFIINGFQYTVREI